MLSDEILNIQEVSDYLKIPVSTVYKLAQGGKVPAVKVGKHWRFMKKDLDHLLNKKDGHPAGFDPKRKNSMKMKAEFINPFLEATISVLKTMAFLEAIPGKPSIKKGNSSVGDVSGIVGITGEAEGSLCITFSKECILFIISQMLGAQLKDINEEVKDAVGELTNMIRGFPEAAAGDGLHVSGGDPSVISGQGHEVKHITKGPILFIPFSSMAGNFVVEVCFK